MNEYIKWIHYLPKKIDGKYELSGNIIKIDVLPFFLLFTKCKLCYFRNN